MAALTTALVWIGKGSRAASVPRRDEYFGSKEAVERLLHKQGSSAAPLASSVAEEKMEENADDTLLKAVAEKQTEEEKLDALMKDYDSDDEADKRGGGGGGGAKGNVASQKDEDDIDDAEDDSNDVDRYSQGSIASAVASSYPPPGIGAAPAMYANNSEDPYLAASAVNDDDADSDFDDFVIRPDDLLLCTAHTQEDGEFAHVDFEVVEPREKFNNYVHHDLVAPSFPLSLEWIDWRPGLGPVVQHRSPLVKDEQEQDEDEDDLDEQEQLFSEYMVGGLKPGQQGANLLAIGSFNPGIEIWDLDVLDTLEPVAVLGGTLDGEPGTLLEGSHADAVLGLSANRRRRQLLASASADKSVRVWDLEQGSLLTALTHHSDKVQAVAWHPAEASVLLSGSFDGSAAVVDVRAASAVSKFPLAADCEALAWDPHQPTRFFVSLDNGFVSAFNATAATANSSSSSSSSSLAASRLVHWQAATEKGDAVTGLAFHPGTAGILATCSLDGHWRLWDVSESQLSKQQTPQLLHDNECDAPLFALSFCEDFPSLLCVVGKGYKRIVDVNTLPAILNHRSMRNKRGARNSSAGDGGPGYVREELVTDEGRDEDSSSSHEDARFLLLSKERAAIIMDEEVPAEDKKDKKKAKKNKKPKKNNKKKRR